MAQLGAIFGLLGVGAFAAYGVRVAYLRSLALERLDESDAHAAEETPRAIKRSPLARPWMWAPWAAAIIVGVVSFLFQVPWPYCVSLAVICGLLGSQLESFLAARKAARLEMQLADAIDIMVGALGAGAGVGGALDAAISEARRPLLAELEDLRGRLRYGDQPAVVFRQFSQRIPLEVFLLFTSTLAVHWSVGGSLAQTLATVGRTVRDRIEITRTIRSNITQSQLSTGMVLALTYFIALVVYGNGPDQMREFLATSIGSFFVAGSILLQAVGIVWMAYLSRMRF